MTPDAPDAATSEPARRPIAARSSGWAIRLAARLARDGVSPNQISMLSIGFAAIGCALIAAIAHPFAWIAAALCVQLRLVCNLLDGMVAIEGGRKSAVGALYNEFPDRIADTLLLVPVGYAAGMPWAGWCAALMAALTAYVRVFGGALGLPQDFSGVMAKQRRMALLTVGLVAQSIEWAFSPTTVSLGLTILAIGVGGAVTCATRAAAIAKRLRSA